MQALLHGETYRLICRQQVASAPAIFVPILMKIQHVPTSLSESVQTSNAHPVLVDSPEFDAYDSESVASWQPIQKRVLQCLHRVGNIIHWMEATNLHVHPNWNEIQSLDSIEKEL